MTREIFMNEYSTEVKIFVTAKAVQSVGATRAVKAWDWGKGVGTKWENAQGPAIMKGIRIKIFFITRIFTSIPKCLTL